MTFESKIIEYIFMGSQTKISLVQYTFSSLFECFDFILIFAAELGGTCNSLFIPISDDM